MGLREISRPVDRDIQYIYDTDVHGCCCTKLPCRRNADFSGLADLDADFIGLADLDLSAEYLIISKCIIIMGYMVDAIMMHGYIEFFFLKEQPWIFLVKVSFDFLANLIVANK